ncbi:reverse transcriptase domain-containing protein, partial [Tanacetum coccineum]
MAELLRVPTEGYAEAIVVPSIPAEHFELKHSLINLVTSKQFFGFEKGDPHAHIRYFNKITSTLKYKDVPEESIKLMLFPFSIDGPARIWLNKEPPHSILTWDDLVSKFINHFFPPLKTTNLHNEISNFNQKFEEMFNSLNSTAGGNLLERSAQDVLKIIENTSKVRNSRNKPIVSQVKTSNVDSSDIASTVASVVTSAMTAMFKQHQVTPAPAFVKAVEESCVTCGGAHSYRQCPATDGNTFLGYHDNIQGYVSSAAFLSNEHPSSSGLGSLPSNTIANPKGELKAITTQSGIVLDGPSVPIPPPFINPEEDERVEEMLTDPELVEYTIKVPPPIVQKPQAPSQKSYEMPKRDPLHLNILYPSRMNKEKQQDKDEIQIHKFWQ